MITFLRLFKNFINKFLFMFSYSLISNKSLKNRSEIAGILVDYIVDRYDVFDYINGSTGIVFSKDRALQLHALIYSYLKNTENSAKLKIIYKCSSPYHKNSYEQLKMEILNKSNLFEFYEEMDSFKSSLTNVLRTINTNKIFFLVDDIIFIDKFDFNIINRIDLSKFIYSLRLSSKCIYSYTTKSKHSVPNLRIFRGFGESYLEFDWFESNNEWSDPYSLDGHFYQTSEVIVKSSVFKYNGPNSYENILKNFGFPGINKKGICKINPNIINLPVNKIQIENNNYSGTAEVEYYLKMWNAGFALDTSLLEKHIPISTHEEHYLPFINRSLLL